MDDIITIGEDEKDKILNPWTGRMILKKNYIKRKDFFKIECLRLKNFYLDELKEKYKIKLKEKEKHIEEYIEFRYKNVDLRRDVSRLETRLLSYEYILMVEYNKNHEEMANYKDKLNNSLANRDLLKCCICLDNAKNVMFLNCAHIVVCTDCITILREHNNKCPICRQKVYDYLIVYI